MTPSVDRRSSDNDRNTIAGKQEKLSDLAKGFLYDLRMDLNLWIKEARKGRGWTQEALSIELSVTRGNVSAWENGLHEPSLSQIKRIAELCGVSPCMLFSGEASASEEWPFAVPKEKFERAPEIMKARVDAYMLGMVESLDLVRPEKQRTGSD